jgi:hypothetical protein
MTQEEYKNFKEKLHLDFLKYEKKLHLQLLKKKSLLKENFKKNESRKDFLQLLNYSELLSRQLDWETRDQYLELIQNFLKQKISIGDFLYEFYQRGLINDDVVQILESNLIVLSLDSNSFNFGTLLKEIFEKCEEYEPEQDNAEKNFYNFVEKKFLEIQDSLNFNE